MNDPDLVRAPEDSGHTFVIETRLPWERGEVVDEDGPAELAPFLIRLRRARVRVFGDFMERTLSVLSGALFPPGEIP